MRHPRELVMLLLGASLLSGCGFLSAVHSDAAGNASKNNASGAPASHKLTASALPKAYPSYSMVVSTVGRLLAQSAQVPVYLPRLGPLFNHTSIDVLYSLKGGGYRLSLGGGPALPANSPKIGFGNAEYIYTVRGLPWSSSFQSRYLPLRPKPSAAQYGPLSLAPGITARSYPAASPPSSELQEQMLISWHEDGWPMNLYGIGISSQSVVSSARQIAQSLRGRHLPGTHGRATFAIGSDAPSIATYDLSGTRYVIETTGFRAAQWALGMMPIRP